MTDAYQPIENYGIIGDLTTVALVGLDASIDFLCFPEFDSPSVFAALLDSQKGGHFQIRPCLSGAATRQMYLPDTNVLLTRFQSPEGIAEISDFMPIHDGTGNKRHRIVRRVKCVKGEFRLDLACEPRFDYARTPHVTELTETGAEFRLTEPVAGVAGMRLVTDLELTNTGTGVASLGFPLAAGESKTVVLEDIKPTDVDLAPSSLDPAFCTNAFKETVDFWRNWIGQSQYRGRWRETVNRSALTLKLLFSESYGSLVAAPTFGLPEEIGGERNWDYRYTWIRDASFTLYSLMRLGYTQEAGWFMDWIEARAADLNPDGSLQIMYGIDGRKELTESELSDWEGYMGSRPVRIGNGAYDQLQLDIYGELMDSVYIYNKYGEPISHSLWLNLVKLVNWVCDNWERPDEGIWEVRGGKREFLYSRLMTWVAVDRAIRLSQKRSFPAPVIRWREVRDEIYEQIHTDFWSEKRQAFVQYKGSEVMDGSTLLMPLVKFISPRDPRWLSTLRAIEEDLVEDSHVYRYVVSEGAHDGLAGEEGTFNMVSFWYAECLALSGDADKARYVFEKMLGYANHLGLFGEELGPHGEQLGNYPQAFTHLGLVSAAYAIDRALTQAPVRFGD